MEFWMLFVSVFVVGLLEPRMELASHVLECLVACCRLCWTSITVEGSKDGRRPDF